MLGFQIWDVFTERAFSGNPLAVVSDADVLTTAQMQAMARQFNLSETIFVMAPRDRAHTARVRIFTPTAEIPFAGHPTIGCALHLSKGRDMRIVLEEKAGPVPVQVRDGQADFIAPRLPVMLPGRAEPGLIARALDLPADAIGPDGHQPGIWQGGPAFLFVPIRDPASLAAARPVEPCWSQAVVPGIVGAYLYTPDRGGYRARMFAPTAGIPEDPATGSASAILAGPLLASGVLSRGENRIALRQGIEMGRPSRIGLTAIVRDGALTEIRISGRAAKVAEGRITIPEVE